MFKTKCAMLEDRIAELESKIAMMVEPVKCKDCSKSVRMRNGSTVICGKFKEIRPVDFWCKFGSCDDV